MKDVSKDIEIIEMCFSGHHQKKKYQLVNTELLNDLIYTIKSQKGIIKTQE